MLHFTPLGEQKSRQNNLRLRRAGGPANFTVLDSKHDATPLQAENEQSPTNSAPIHERFLREGRLAKTRGTAAARCSSAIKVWKSVVVTWSGRGREARHSI